MHTRNYVYRITDDVVVVDIDGVVVVVIVVREYEVDVLGV